MPGEYKQIEKLTDTIVTLADFKRHQIIQFDNDDEISAEYLCAAIEYCERHTERSLLLTRWKVAYRCWTELATPEGAAIHNGPLRVVEAIEYVDSDGVTQTLDPSEYDYSSQNGMYDRIRVCSTPGLSEKPIYPIIVTIIAGYGSLDTMAELTGYQGAYNTAYGIPLTISDIPKGIKQAIRMLSGHWYENRETAIVGTSAAEVPFAVAALLHHHRSIEV